MPITVFKSVVTIMHTKVIDGKAFLVNVYHTGKVDEAFNRLSYQPDCLSVQLVEITLSLIYFIVLVLLNTLHSSLLKKTMSTQTV